MAQRTGLGKGLGSLIPQANKRPADAGLPQSHSIGKSSGVQKGGVSSKTDGQQIPSGSIAMPQISPNTVYEIPVDAIIPNPMQPRQIFEHKGLEDLVASIKEHGILQPLTVTKNGNDSYELIAGERRLRSAKIAGLKTVPAIVRTAGEMEKLELALIENIQRRDLNPIEKAESYYKLIDEFALTQEEAAKRLGIQRSTMANTLRLLSLPSEIQKALADGKLTQGHARALIALESPKEQMRLFKKIVMTGMNVRDTEAQARQVSKTKKRAAYDPNLEDKKNRIQAALGTKAEIKHQGNGGKIIIHYYSQEELSELINKMGE